METEETNGTIAADIASDGHVILVLVFVPHALAGQVETSCINNPNRQYHLEFPAVVTMFDAMYTVPSSASSLTTRARHNSGTACG